MKDKTISRVMREMGSKGGKRGGPKGGGARMDALSAEERTALAKEGSQGTLGKSEPEQLDPPFVRFRKHRNRDSVFGVYCVLSGMRCDLGAAGDTRLTILCTGPRGAKNEGARRST